MNENNINEEKNDGNSPEKINVSNTEQTDNEDTVDEGEKSGSTEKDHAACDGISGCGRLNIAEEETSKESIPTEGAASAEVAYAESGIPTTDTAENSSVSETEIICTKTEAKPKRERALSVACLLSACSILLLVAFAISLMLGIFPIDDRSLVLVGVSTNGATEPDKDASPELIEDFLRSVVVVKGKTLIGTSTGTGVVISENGYIVTNYHVVEGCDIITVQLYGEENAITASVIGFHADDDVAVIKIERDGLRAATFANSETVRYGEKVYAIGTPEGSDFAWSVTQGIVSCPLRQLMIYNDDGTLEKKMYVVQTDASVNHGNSGGPIINIRGEVVGIVTLKRSNSAGMGFALPSNGVLTDIKSIIEVGHADNVQSGISMPRPLLGINGGGVEADTYYRDVILEDGALGREPVDEEYAKANPDTTIYASVSGVYVNSVNESADAAKHLKKGDIITKVNGEPVTMIYDVMDVVNKYNGGDSITVTFYRNGKYHTAEIILGTSKELG